MSSPINDIDKTVNINIYKQNKGVIESSTNKSESYLILANEELNNKNKQLLDAINELDTTITELETDNERMEKSITYQRGLLHNFNGIKKYQSNKIQKYMELVKLNNNFNTEVHKKISKKYDSVTFFLLLGIILYGLSLSFLNVDMITGITHLIINLTIFYQIDRTIYKFNKEDTLNTQNYNKKCKNIIDNINNINNDIKHITSKNDYISDMIDNA